MAPFLAFLSLVVISTSAFADGVTSSCEVMMGGAYEDYSQSHKYQVFGVVTPNSLEELAHIVRTTNRPISVRGAGFSMGGQTASNHGLVIDMKKLNKVTAYNPKDKNITVQAGATWYQIQQLIDPNNLSVMIMQSYNNFQVGGSISVNAHGRYVGYGPLVSSVVELKVMLADGNIVTASRTQNPDIFSAVVGGYAAIGIVVEAKLNLADNVALERTVKRFKNDDIAVAVEQSLKYFEEQIEKDPKSVMYNADIYPKAYDTVDVIAFKETDKQLTNTQRLQTPAPSGILGNLVQAAKVSLEQLTDTIKRYRVEKVVPNDLATPTVVNRNYEASYDNSYLKPLADRVPGLKVLPIANRKALLQEYFIPRKELPQFIAKMKRIFLDNDVNVSNVSLRHVPKNNESMLSWSKVDSIAVVVYYTQAYGKGKDRDGNLTTAKDWTREMIAEVEKTGGSFYLPYQIYATRDQFNHAYPRHQEFFDLKKKYDPTTKFNNSLWDQYRLSEDTYHYRDLLATQAGKEELKAYFTNIFSINDPDRFLMAVEEAMKVTKQKGRDINDRSVYDELLKILPKYANGTLTKAKETIKALRVQQMEMAKQMAAALNEVGQTQVDGYLEIGSPGRYVWPLKKLIKMSKKIFVMNDTFSIANWIETSFGWKIPAVAVSKKLKFSNYDQIQQSEIPNETLDAVSMFIGLHHCPPEKLPAFVASINRVLKVGGKFILRDHDANERMLAMAFMAHSTYNAGLGLSYDEELNEVRNLQPLQYWIKLMEQAGFKLVGSLRKQEGDPTGNTLMTFEKVARTPEVENAIRESISKDGPGLNLDLLPGYHRAQSNTYMTQAEWFLVDIFKELSQFTKKSPWYDFPFDKFLNLYDQVYKKTSEFAQREGLRDEKAFKQYDEMDRQLMSGIKAMFKAMKFAANRVRSKAEGMSTEQIVNEQKMLSDFFGDYAHFMTHTPWYMFPHRRTLTDLEKAYQGRMSRATTSMLSKMKILFGGMDFVARLVRWGLKEELVEPTTQFLLRVNDEVPSVLTNDETLELKQLTDEFVLARTQRYMPFTRVMKAIADTNVQVAQVAGNQYISVLVKAQESRLTLMTPTDAIMDYQYPTAILAGGESAVHHMIRVRVSNLPALLKECGEKNLEVVRVHDY